MYGGVPNTGACRWSGDHPRADDRRRLPGIDGDRHAARQLPVEIGTEPAQT